VTAAATTTTTTTTMDKTRASEEPTVTERLTILNGSARRRDAACVLRVYHRGRSVASSFGLRRLLLLLLLRWHQETGKRA